MKKLILLLTAIILIFSAPVYAEQSVQSGDAQVTVNGLVCDFCARALEKVFSKEEAVEAISVDMDTKLVTVNFNDGQSLDDDRLTQLITDAGYNVENINRVK